MGPQYPPPLPTSQFKVSASAADMVVDAEPMLHMTALLEPCLAQLRPSLMCTSIEHGHLTGHRTLCHAKSMSLRINMSLRQ